MAAHEIIHPIWSDIVSRTVIVTLLIVTGCAIVGYFAKGEFQRQYWRRFRTMTLLIVVLLVFAYVGGWLFNLLITGLTIAAMWELWRSQYELGRVGIKWTIVGSIATLPTISHYFGITGIFIAICAVATMALVSLSFVHAQVRQQIKIALLGFACIGIPAALIVLIRSEGGFGAMVFFLAVVQLADLGAYLGGRRWGRRKLVATLSPGKTWEGLFCGAMAAVGGALIFAYTLPVWSFAELVIIALILTVIGLLGDLFASYLKRLRRVKDFGSLLPGHGGVIDRFDSYFATAPITWLLLASPLFATLRTNQDSATIFVFLLVTLLSSLTLVAFLVYALDRAIGNRISTEMRPVSRTTR